MRERVRAANHEGVEGEPRVERRSAQRLMCSLRGLLHGAQIAIAYVTLEVTGNFGRLGRLHLDGRIAQHRRTMHHIDAPDCRQFRLPAGEQLVGVMRLHPAFKEARRHREPHGVVVDCIMAHGAKPALEDFFADRGAQARLHAQPSLLIRMAHRLALMRLSRTRGRRGHCTRRIVHEGR